MLGDFLQNYKIIFTKKIRVKLTGIVHQGKAQLQLSYLHKHVNEWELGVLKFILNKYDEMQLQCKYTGDSVIQCPRWEKMQKMKQEHQLYVWNTIKHYLKLL